jgi:hypothetical protein
MSTFPPYSPDWFLHSDRERLLEVISLHATRVDAPLALGDIATFRFGRAVSHAGIVVALDPLRWCMPTAHCAASSCTTSTKGQGSVAARLGLALTRWRGE